MTLPEVLTQGQVDDSLDVAARAGNVAHEIAFRPPVTTGLRIAELVSVRREHADVPECRSGEQAGIPQMRPHLFRHHTLMRLTQAKLSAAQIKLLLGHSSQKSLGVYQHLALTGVAEDYQEATAHQPRGRR